MITPAGLTYLFTVNHNIIMKKVANVTHEESVRQPECAGNCFNWVLGHLIMTRDEIIRQLGGEAIWDTERGQRYGFGSLPVSSVDDPTVVPFETMVEDYPRQHERLIALLAVVDPARFDDTWRDETTIGKYLLFSTFHDAFHTGQTEYLRELAGHSDNRI